MTNKKTLTSNLIFYLILLVFGIILFTNPNTMLNIVSYTLGIIFIIIGTYKIVDYAKNKENSIMHIMNLFAGIFAILLGMTSLIFPSTIPTAIKIIFGLWILYNSITQLVTSIKLKKIFNKGSKYLTIVSIISILFALFILFYDGFIIKTIGLTIIIYSVIQIVNYIVINTVDENQTNNKETVVKSKKSLENIKLIEKAKKVKKKQNDQ